MKETERTTTQVQVHPGGAPRTCSYMGLRPTVPGSPDRLTQPARPHLGCCVRVRAFKTGAIATFLQTRTYMSHGLSLRGPNSPSTISHHPLASAEPPSGMEIP